MNHLEIVSLGQSCLRVKSLQGLETEHGLNSSKRETMNM